MTAPATMTISTTPPPIPEAWKQAMGRTVGGLTNGAKLITRGLNDVANDVDAIITTAKFVFYALSAGQIYGCGSDSQCVDHLIQTMQRSADVVEFTRVGEDIPALMPSKVSKDIQDQKYLTLASKCLFVIADVGATFLLLSECGWDKLGECAEMMGSVPLFGELGLSVLQVTQVTAVAGFALLTIDSAITLGKGLANNTAMPKDWVALCVKIGSLAFKVFVISGCSTAYPTLFVVWGMVSAGSGLVSFFVGKYGAGQPEAKVQAMVSTPAVKV